MMNLKIKKQITTVLLMAMLITQLVVPVYAKDQEYFYVNNSGGKVTFSGDTVTIDSGEGHSGAYFTTLDKIPTTGKLSVEYEIVNHNPYYLSASIGSYVFLSNYEKVHRNNMFAYYFQPISDGIYFQTYGNAAGPHILNVLATDTPWGMYPAYAGTSQKITPITVPAYYMGAKYKIKFNIDLDTGVFTYWVNGVIVSQGTITAAWMDKLGENAALTFYDGNYGNHKVTYSNIIINGRHFFEDDDFRVIASTEAITQAQTTMTQSAIDNARLLVEKVTTVEQKIYLTNQLNALQLLVNQELEDKISAIELSIETMTSLAAADAIIASMEGLSEAQIAELMVQLNARILAIKDIEKQLKISNILTRINEIESVSEQATVLELMTGLPQSDIDYLTAQLELKITEIEHRLTQIKINEIISSIDNLINISEKQTIINMMEGLNETDISSLMGMLDAKVSSITTQENQSKIQSIKNTINSLTSAAEKQTILSMMQGLNQTDITLLTALLDNKISSLTPTGPVVFSKEYKAADNKIDLAMALKREPHITNAIVAINAVTNALEKELLLEEMQIVLDKVNSVSSIEVTVASNYVRLAEVTSREKYITLAEAKITLVANTPAKSELINRMDMVKAVKTIEEAKAYSLLISAEQWKSTQLKTQASTVINSLADSQFKTALLNRLAVLN